jgi:hypothetical protein
MHLDNARQPVAMVTHNYVNSEILTHSYNIYIYIIYIYIIGFINNLQVVTTITYYTTALLHNLQSLHINLLSLSALVYTYLSHGSYTSVAKSHTPNITALQHVKSSITG